MKKSKLAIRNLKTYLDHIEDAAEKLDTEQDAQLANILSVQLSLLIALKKQSRLGEVNFDHLFVKEKKSTRRPQVDEWGEED